MRYATQKIIYGDLTIVIIQRDSIDSTIHIVIFVAKAFVRLTSQNLTSLSLHVCLKTNDYGLPKETQTPVNLQLSDTV